MVLPLPAVANVAIDGCDCCTVRSCETGEATFVVSVFEVVRCSEGLVSVFGCCCTCCCFCALGGWIRLNNSSALIILSADTEMVLPLPAAANVVIDGLDGCILGGFETKGKEATCVVSVFEVPA